MLYPYIAASVMLGTGEFCTEMKGDKTMIFDALAGAYFELCNGIAHMAVCRASTALEMGDIRNNW